MLTAVTRKVSSALANCELSFIARPSIWKGRVPSTAPMSIGRVEFPLYRLRGNPLKTGTREDTVGNRKLAGTDIFNK